MRISKTSLIGMSLPALILTPLIVFGAMIEVGEHPSIGTGTTVGDDLYMAGGDVSLAGRAQGDVYAVGGTVLINGTVAADLVAAGGTVSVTGTVADDLRIGGGTVLVQGTIGDDLVVGGGEVIISGNRIGGDVLVGGGVVRLQSEVAGSAKIGGGEVLINAPIGGHVEVRADQLTLGENAVINGNLTFKGPEAPTIHDGAVVRGTIEHQPIAKGRDSKEILAAFITFGAIACFLTLLAGSLFVAFVLKRFTGELVHYTHAEPWWEIGRGFLTLIALPIASILLMVTIIGIPFGILGLMAFVGLLIFGWLLAPIVLGSFVYGRTSEGHWKKPDWKSVAIGVVLFWLVGFIPVIGWFAQCLFVLMTVGAIVHLKLSVAKQWR